MKLELKNVRLGIHSEETTDYKATLFVDGVAAALVSNTGHGGQTDIFKLDKELVEQAEQYAKTLPPVIVDGLTLDMTLDFWCDQAAEQEVLMRNVRRLQKNFLVLDNGEKWITKGWKGHPIKQMLELYLPTVRKAISEAKAQGFKVLNENIPAELL